MKRKFFSMITAVALVLSLLPVTAFAEGNGTADDPWICGDGVTAVLEGDTLTISYDGNGSGAMANYGLQSSRPWNGSKESILNVVIQDGVTSIGKSAFEAFRKVTGIEIPDTVTSIGERAFFGCYALSSIDLPAGLRSIEIDTFAGCKALTGIKIPDSVRKIGDSAFNEAGLTEVKVPDGVTSIGSWAFGNCANLNAVEIPASVTSIGSGAFSGSGNAEIYYAGALEEWNEIAGAGECGVQEGKLHVVAPAGAVAKVGDASYTTVQAAVDAAAQLAGGGTVTLLDDVTVDQAVTVTSGTVTLDGQGTYTLTGTGYTTISVEGGSLKLENVTVENTSAGQELSPGVVVVPGTVISVMGSGILTVSDGSTVRATGKDGWGIYYSGATAQINIEGGTISGGKGFQFNTTGGFTADKVSLTGGTFIGTTGNAIYVPDGFTLGQLLGEGLALINNGTGAAVERTEVQTGPGAFAVEECRHKGAAGASNKDGTHSVNCPYCGHTGTAENCAYTFGGTATGVCAACGDSVTVEVAGTENLAYTGSEIKPSVAVKRGETALNAGEDYTVTYSDNINAGTAKVTVTIGTEQGSYTGTFHIGPAKPAIAWAKDAEELTYTGRAAELKTRPTVTLAGSGEYDGEEIAYSYTKEGETAAQNGLPMNAGTYYIKAAVPEQNNYATAVTANTLTLTIKKVTTTVTPPAAANPAYNGTAQALITPARTNAGEGAVQYALSADGPWSASIPTATAMGEYTVWYKVDGTDNYTGVEAAFVKAEIGKAQVTDITQSLMVRNGLEKTYTLDLGTLLPGLPEGQTYEKPAYELAETYIDDEAYIDSRTVTLDGSVLTVPVKAVNKAREDLVAIIEVTIKSENFQDIHLVISVMATNQTPLTITGVKAQGWTYDGKVHPGYTGTPRAEGYTGEFQVYYLGYLANGKNRKDAGTFRVEFVLKDTENYVGELSLTYTVEPAQVTVKADDQTATVGDGMPELTYQVSGLAEGESLKTEPTRTCDADMSKAGTYPITVSGGEVPDGGNYRAEIVYQPGTLTVEEKSAPPEPVDPGQIETRMEVEKGISQVPEGLKNIPELDSPPKLEAAMRTSITQTGIPAQNTAVYDVKLMVSNDGGQTWTPATEANFPAAGLTITLPYPAGTDSTYQFTVVHMFTTAAFGQIPGNTESPAVTNTEAGLRFTVAGLSPISVGWKEKEPDRPVTPGRPSGGGGGSDVSTYRVTVERTVHGKVASNRTYAPEDSAVTLTVTPDSGYVLDALTVTDSRGNAVKLTDKGDGRYTFSMPGRAVTVKAGFKAVRTEWNNPYSDVAAGAWYYDAARYVTENGLMKGVGGGHFAPNDTLTRAQLVQILYNRAGRPAVQTGSRFSDVGLGAWYDDAVAWAASEKIVSGVGGGRFAPGDPVTREQMAVMLWRYAGRPAATEKELSFTDADQAGGYALDALRWAVERGIISGKSGGVLDPKGLATRAQTAQMMMNLLKDD